MSVSADSMWVAKDQVFQSRVKYFLVKAAVSVMAEANTVDGHAQRVAYAGKVLDGTANVEQVAVAVMTNSTVAANGYAAPDGDLEFVVNSMFSALSGVSL